MLAEELMFGRSKKQIKAMKEAENIDWEKPFYFLMNKGRKLYVSNTPGLLGGHDSLHIYGRLDCPSAAKFIAKGQYVKHRVFFKDEATAIAAGYRPCGVCMPEKYKLWKAQKETVEE